MNLLEALQSLDKGTMLRVLHGEDAMELVSPEQEIAKLTDTNNALLEKDVFFSAVADEPFTITATHPDDDSYELYMENTFSDKKVIDKLLEKHDTEQVVEEDASE